MISTSSGPSSMFSPLEDVYSPLVGKLVQICDSEIYEDIFGIYLGCFRSKKWDPEEEYLFHQILSHKDAIIHNYCIRIREGTNMIKVHI